MLLKLLLNFEKGKTKNEVRSKQTNLKVILRNGWLIFLCLVSVSLCFWLVVFDIFPLPLSPSLLASSFDFSGFLL